MRKIILALAVVAIIIVSGCASQLSTHAPSAGQSQSGASDSELLQRAEMKENSFFYRGDCGTGCRDVIESYYSVIEDAEGIDIRYSARQKLSEFLFKVKEYDEGITVAKALADNANNNDNGEYMCIGIIMIAQNARGKEDLELSFDMFNSARTFCGEDRQEFIQDNMCSLTAQAGDIEGAKMMCPGKYS